MIKYRAVLLPTATIFYSSRWARRADGSVVSVRVGCIV
jgi:hypothetical protein